MLLNEDHENYLKLKFADIAKESNYRNVFVSTCYCEILSVNIVQKITK